MAIPKTSLTAARLRELLDYNPETGVFHWKIHTGRGRRPGQPAGVVEPSGYRTICVEGHRYQAQRLAWLFMTGEHAVSFIRFKDEDRGNLKWGNLGYGKYVTPGVRTDTKEAHTAYVREMRRQNPGMAREEHLRRTYGLEPDEHRRMHEAQGGRCAVCDKEERVRQKVGSEKWLDVDHCHKTGKIRGLLCNLCNRMLGYVKDDPVTLERAAAYLRRHAAGDPSPVSYLEMPGDHVPDPSWPPKHYGNTVFNNLPGSGGVALTSMSHPNWPDDAISD